MAKYESRRSFLTKTAAATAGLSLGGCTLNAARDKEQVGVPNAIQLTKKGRSISFCLSLPDNTPAVEVRIFSNANLEMPNGWETDAYLLAMTYPEGANPNDPDAITRTLVIDGSYLRREASWCSIRFRRSISA